MMIIEIALALFVYISIPTIPFIVLYNIIK
jgi:hypothetical protein